MQSQETGHQLGESALNERVHIEDTLATWRVHWQWNDTAQQTDKYKVQL